MTRSGSGVRGRATATAVGGSGRSVGADSYRRKTSATSVSPRDRERKEPFGVSAIYVSSEES